MLLEEAIRKFKIEDWLVAQGGNQIQDWEWVLVCPSCGKDKLIVNTRKRTFHCWVCEQYGPPDLSGRRRPIKGAGGLAALLCLFERVDHATAVNKIIASVEFTPTELSTLSRDQLIQGLQQAERVSYAIPAPEGAQPVYATLPYLAKRGISMEDARIFGLFWCASGRYANRLVFPVYEDGQLVYFQARAMWEERDQPGRDYIKTLNPPAVEGAVVSTDVLMNLDTARHAPRVAIVEGPVDCVHAGPSAVCTFGKKISATQILKLLRAGVKAVDLMWDGPSEREPLGAWPEMFRAAPLLSAVFDTRLVFLPKGDPGEYPREHLDWYRQHTAQAAHDVPRIGAALTWR